MWKNYLKIALRSLRYRKGYAAINVFGLAVGMTACLLIGLYVNDELAYDTFHEKADRIMVATMEGDFFGKGTSTPYPLGGVLLESAPSVEQVTRTLGDGYNTDVQRPDASFERKQRLLLADSVFFDAFSFPLVEGDAATVLDAPQHAVITETMARAFFGEASPLGQTLSFERQGEAYTVTVAGLAQDPPPTSTIQFDIIVPIALVAENRAGQRSWGSLSWRTYAVLSHPMRADAFAEELKNAVAPHTQDYSFTFGALALPELYLSDYYSAAGFGGQRRYVYLFGTIALLTLLIAAINYVNLVTAQGEQRAHEVGVRKAVGARREQLAGQFLTETALLGSVALVVALGLVGVALPGFNALLDADLSLEAARSGWALAGLAGFVLVVSIAAGAYPAFVLSRYEPTEVLRGRTLSNSSGSWLRRGLVVGQFAVSAGLILCTAVIYQQLRFLQTENLGFDGEQVVTVNLPVDDTRQQTIKREVLRLSGVERATVADAAPGGFNVNFGNDPANLSSAARTEAESISIRPSKVDADYIETMGLRLLAGRSFSDERPSDRTQGYVLNRTAAEAMGWTPEDAVGQPFLFARSEGASEGAVIGVVEDFHIESLRDPVVPVVLVMESERFSSSGGVLAARLAPDQIGPALERIRATVSAQIPEEEAFEYTFLDDAFNAMYRAETRLARIFAVFAGIAVLVACLGLFGLAAFAAQRRTREIAIRKALGASVANLVGLLSKEFAALVAVALVVGTPVAYWGLQQWLAEFAYHATVGPWMFALTALVALSIAGASTGYQALRAALANPTDALRAE